MAFRREALDAGAIRLHRAGSGPELLLLHCLGVDHRLGDIAAAGLADDLTLLSYDFPGHGETPLSAKPYGIEHLSAQLGGVLSHVGIERAHIAGISLGGLVAQHFAATQPARVDKLVLIDTTPRYTDESRRMWAERAAIARSAGVASLIGGLLRIWFTDAFVAADPAAVRYVRETLTRCSGEGYSLACEALAAAELRPLAHEIKAPTLVVCGEQGIPAFLDAVLGQPDAFRRALHEFLGGRA